VTHGIYSKIRNPIYVFGTLLFAGFVLVIHRRILWRMVLAIAALVSIAFGLIAVGRAWYEFRPLTDKERARLRQEGN